MSDIAQAPLRRFSGDALVEDTGPTGMVTLRGTLRSGAILSAVQGALGLGVPAVRRVESGPRGAVLWMSPDELMLVCPVAEAAGIADSIAEKLAGEHFLALDLSSARSRFRISGAGARDVLAKGAPVDLSPATFGVGELRRTRLGSVAVAFWCTGPDMFELICFRSVADHVYDWLCLAARPGGRVGLY
ncbi:sarcosine oxidase subunit gamma [Paroceanicella profunda]|uniref:Sarcosine oxidase subunit gamma n=1 Tax=Paroceanicella profunda TaxID=2579971 RepID=A0A5B8FID0_9RHOB|nr:sarcosine oxidase subunit gamma family protein [Paroceanicella profunda]QDL93107.1 sarcosine oxidase subunit gamma [Paroceanicella profunda]